ncbi:MAG: hypothetical protein HUU38_09990 [Anaerolineales bacterium]|nr:hypothetical protein [Anaerolineales bacterium]
MNKGHGRLETRECWVIEQEEYLAYMRGRSKWVHLKSLVRIVSKRYQGEKTETQIRYFISSLPVDAKLIFNAKRSHW